MCRVYLWIAFFLRRLTHSVRSLSFNSDHKQFFSSAFECATSLPLPSGLFSFIKFYARERKLLLYILFLFLLLPKCIFHTMDGHWPRFVIHSMVCYVCVMFCTCRFLYIWRMTHSSDAAIFVFSITFFLCSLFVCLCVCVWMSECVLVAICYCCSLDACVFCVCCWSFRYLWPLSERKMSIEETQTMKNDTNELHTNITHTESKTKFLCPLWLSFTPLAHVKCEWAFLFSSIFFV